MAGEHVRGAGPTDARDELANRILPRTALGLAVLLFFMAVSAAFSGSALFAYYRFQRDDPRERVAQPHGHHPHDLAPPPHHRTPAKERVRPCQPTGPPLPPNKNNP